MVDVSMGLTCSCRGSARQIQFDICESGGGFFGIGMHGPSMAGRDGNFDRWLELDRQTRGAARSVLTRPLESERS